MKYEKVRILRVHRLPRLLFYHHVMRSFIQSINCSYLNYYFFNFFFFFFAVGTLCWGNWLWRPVLWIDKIAFGPRKLYNNTSLSPPEGHVIDHMQQAFQHGRQHFRSSCACCSVFLVSRCRSFWRRWWHCLISRTDDWHPGNMCVSWRLCQEKSKRIKWQTTLSFWHINSSTLQS